MSIRLDTAYLSGAPLEGRIVCYKKNTERLGVVLSTRRQEHETRGISWLVLKVHWFHDGSASEESMYGLNDFAVITSEAVALAAKYTEALNKAREEVKKLGLEK